MRGEVVMALALSPAAVEVRLTDFHSRSANPLLRQ